MRVLRGRAGSIDADRALSRRLLEWAEGGETAVRAWCPHRQVAFGRRDVRSDGFERATSIARERGFPPVERDVGGRAVAYTGSTVAFARAEPAAGRGGIDERYDRASGDLRRALSTLGVDARGGEPDDSFCPGSYSLQAAGGKVAGLAQRVTDDAVLVAGLVVVDGHEDIADVLDPVYDALDEPFEPDTVGSIERAGGKVDPVAIIMRLEDALVGDHLGTVEWVDDLATVEWSGE